MEKDSSFIKNNAEKEYEKKNVEKISPLISYYKSSNIFLRKKYAEKNNSWNIDKSRNFIRKDSINEKENRIISSKTKEGEILIEENIKSNNKMLNNDSLKVNKEKYNKLKEDFNYYHTDYDNFYLKESIYNNNTNSNKNVISINENTKLDNFKNQYTLINNNNKFMKGMINSTNINFITPIFSNKKFGKKGWICPYCNNYNYEKRIKCNICKQSKNIINNKIKSKGNGIGELNIFDGKINNLFSERESDWICFNCKNLNFGFRFYCNRCKLSRIDSQKLMLLNYHSIQNEMSIIKF